jgi:exonuclease VII large subunit
MGRGYAVLSGTPSGAIITAAAQVRSGDRLSAQLADGRLYCTVDSVSREAPEFSRSAEKTLSP